MRVRCLFREDGEAVEEIIRSSFLIFIKKEMAMLKADSFPSDEKNDTPLTEV